MEAFFWEAVQRKIGQVSDAVQSIIKLQKLCGSGALGLIDAGDIPEMVDDSKTRLARMSEEEIIKMFGKPLSPDDILLTIGEKKVIILLSQTIREEGIARFLPPAQSSNTVAEVTQPINENDFANHSSSLLARIRGEYLET